MSVIARPEEVEETVAHAKAIVNDPDLLQEIIEELAQWRLGLIGHIGKKQSQDLQVLYLCGSEPLNDLEVLLANGIVPQNVWAVESMREDIGRAREALAASYPTVQLHPGDLADLLHVYPGQLKNRADRSTLRKNPPPLRPP